MKPARKRRPYFKKAKFCFKFGYLLLFLFLALVFSFFLLRNLFIPSLNNSLVIPRENGDVVVGVFNKDERSIVSIVIPKDTQLELSNQLGSWRAKSVWQLGINEKLEGILLSRSIEKNFHLPVYAWSDEDALGFIEGGFLGTIKALFLNYKTNLKIGDRLNMVYFGIFCDRNKKEVLNLEDYQILKQQKLQDGEVGYVVSKDVPLSIKALFTEKVLTEENNLVSIENATKSRKVAESVGETLESLGFKVGSIKDIKGLDNTCEVSSKFDDLAKRVSDIYNCNILKEEKSEFVLTIKLGQDFLKSY